MGTFSLEISVSDQAQSRVETMSALVDSGATNTVIPSEVLRRLGISPHRTSTFQLADGRELELEIGRAWVRVDGQQEYTQVVFGPPGSEPILGAITLEEMNLSIDPIAQRVFPVNRYLM
jgi:clan AA aspartic protease